MTHHGPLVAKAYQFRYVIVLSVVAAAIILSVGVANSPLFDVDRVVVKGETRAERQKILDAAQIDIGTKMVEVDHDSIRRRIMEIGTIADVSVDRKLLSGTIELVVYDRQPEFSVVADTGYVALDFTGVQLHSTNVKPEGLIHIEGPKLNGAEGEVADANTLGAVQMVTELSAEAIERLDGFSVSEAGEVAAVLDGASPVLFGTGVDAKQKSVDLDTVLEKVDLDCLETLDFGVPTQPIVTRKAECSG